MAEPQDSIDNLKAKQDALQFYKDARLTASADLKTASDAQAVALSNYEVAKLLYDAILVRALTSKASIEASFPSSPDERVKAMLANTNIQEAIRQGRQLAAKEAVLIQRRAITAARVQAVSSAIQAERLAALDVDAALLRLRNAEQDDSDIDSLLLTFDTYDSYSVPEDILDGMNGLEPIPADPLSDPDPLPGPDPGPLSGS